MPAVLLQECIEEGARTPERRSAERGYRVGKVDESSIRCKVEDTECSRDLQTEVSGGSGSPAVIH